MKKIYNFFLGLIILFCFYQTILAIGFSVIFIKKFFFTKEKNLIKRYGKNSWVIITGGSGGQGKQFALKLAKRGFNIFIIGYKSSLKVEKEINKKFPTVKTKVIIKDLGKSYINNFFDNIENACSNIDVSILINNVGHRTGWIPSHKQPPQDIIETIACGTIVQSRLTQILIKKFLNRPKKYKSCIIFTTAQCMHSNFGLSIYPNEISVPYIGVYEAANSFGYYHACSIYKEYKNEIDILNITPGAVITENTHYLKGTLFSTTSPKFVKNIIKLMGNVQGTTFAHWGHSISNTLVSFFPFIKNPILEKVGRKIAIDYMKRSQKKPL